MDADCIFCKIVAGQIPSHKVYEDDAVYAFLDIGPVAKGHTLVIPKAHAVTLDELPEASGAAVGAALTKVSGAVAKAVGAEGWNVLQNNGRVAGQLVMHVHFHIIPRFGDDPFGYRWPSGELAGEQAETLTAAITAALT